MGGKNESINLGETKSVNNPKYNQASKAAKLQNMDGGSKPPPEAIVPLEEPPYCKVLSNGAGASLVLTKDTIGNFRHSKGKDKSGYGPHFPHSAAIDLVVGRGGSYARENKIKPGKAIHASFKGKYSDAARIYISQLCDVDRAFVLPDTNMQSEAKSAIALKADAIRIIGDEGVKIIARSDSTNSHGKEIGFSGIHLIANPGTNGESEPLQPLVKGENLLKALIGVNKNMNTLNGLISELTLCVQMFIQAFNGHVHLSQGPAAPGTMTPMQLLTKPVQSALNNTIHKIGAHVDEISKHSINHYGMDPVKLKSGPPTHYINSRYNKTN